MKPPLVVGALTAMLALATGADALAQTPGRFPDVEPGPTEPHAPSSPSMQRGPTTASPASQLGTRGPTYAQPTWGAPPSAQPTPTLGFRPSTLPYREGDAIPAGYRLDESSDGGLMLAGGLGLGIAYLAAAGIGLSDMDNGRGWLLLPIIGPFAAIGARESPCTKDQPDRDCIDEAVDEGKNVALLLLNGLVQLAGASVFVGGMASRTRVLVLEDGPSVQVAPRFGSQGVEMTLRGRF